MTTFTRRAMLTGTAAAGAAAMVSAPAAQAAAPLAGTQAPGWYRYKVGSFEVTVVTDGGNAAPLSDGYVANASVEAISDALAADFLDRKVLRGSYTPVVVNTGARLVAIDTGLGPAMYEKSKRGVGQYQTNLKAAGIDRNAIDVVIISHFHGDHIGGLVDADNKPLFPNAEVMVPAVEWNFWADESNMSRVPKPAAGTFANVKRVFGALGKNVARYDAGKELVSGITAVASYGHTPGHTSHVVASGNARVLVQADVTAGVAAVFLRNPEWQFLFDTDKAMAVATRRRINDMAAAEKMPVQGYHFPFPSIGHVEKSSSGYRLVPVPWSPVL